MSYLSAGELHSMRQTANQALAGTAVIHRAATVSDGQGGETQTWAAAGTVVCNLAPVTRRSGDENVIADRLTSQPWWYLTVPALTDVGYPDRVVAGGGTFEVIGMREPRSVEIVRRAVLSQIA